MLILSCCFFILFILYLLMLPVKNTPGEIQTAYFIIAVPDTLKRLAGYALFGFLILPVIYYKWRTHKHAVVSFNDDSIFIAGDGVDILIPHRMIRKIFCNNLRHHNGEPKEQLQVVIEQKHSRTTSFRLKHYEEGGALLDIIASLQQARKHVEFGTYDREMIGDDEEP